MIYMCGFSGRYNIATIDTRDAFLLSSPYGFYYPLGLSLEAASIEPSRNILFAYLCTNGNEARMYKVPLDGMQRASAFQELEEDEDAGVLLRSMRSMASPGCRLPARFFFTMQGRLFYQKPYNETLQGAMDIYRAGTLLAYCHS